MDPHIIKPRLKVITTKKSQTARKAPYQEFHILGMIPRGGPVLRDFFCRLPVQVFEQTGKAWIPPEKVEGNIPVFRPTSGVLTGVKVMDREGTLAAMAKVALSWLEEETMREIIPPALPRTELKFRYLYQNEAGTLSPAEGILDRSCLQCRWYRRQRNGSDEWGVEASDFSDEEGEVLRDAPADMYTGGEVSQAQCTLFGTYIEELFHLTDTLNDMIQFGVRNELVNIRCGFDSMPTSGVAGLRQKMLPAQDRTEPLDPDDEYVPSGETPSSDPTGEWANRFWFRENLLASTNCGFHRERSKFRNEVIPWSWMPEPTKGEVIAPGGITLRR